MAANVGDLKRKSGDVAWDYAELCRGNRDKVKCALCNKIVSGGISCLKHHIAGIGGQVSSCPKATPIDKERCKNAIEGVKKKKNEVRERLQYLRDSAEFDVEDDVLEGSSKKSPHMLGPMDQYATPIESSSSNKELKQKKLDDSLFKKRALEVDAYLARWIYASDVPFNAINNDEWKLLMQAIGQFGPEYESPSLYRLREPLLKQEVEKMKVSLNIFDDEWKKSGCSVMIDVWSDRKRSIMNLCVNCKLGTVFLSSKEDSLEEHSGAYIFDYVDGHIDKIGEENVVQVVTDNATNNMAAAKMLKVKRPHIFWTSCATHTINLILEGIGKLPIFAKVIQKAKALTIFIYTHHKTLALMRKFCKNKEIVRPGATRFATSFLTLRSLLKKRSSLMQMFFSNQWNKCKFASSSKGKKVVATVCSTTFWNDVDLCVNVFEPLVRVFRLVGGDVKPSMGFVVGYIIEAKEKIVSACGGNELLVRSIFAIIEAKSKDRLDTPLHLTSYLLNPIYFYRNIDDEMENRCINAFSLVSEAIFPSQVDKQCSVSGVEFLKYKMKEGMFGRTPAIAHWKKGMDAEFDPVGWWTFYGSQTPNLKKLAIKILSLTSSSFGCERNWSTFGEIHMKKQNRLDATRLNDLVYFEFNSKLQSMRARNSEKKDSLVSNDDSMTLEWKVKGGDEDDEESNAYMRIPCEVIASAMEADDVLENCSSTRGKRKRVLIDDEEEEYSDDDDINEDEDEDEEEEEDDDY